MAIRQADLDAQRFSLKKGYFAVNKYEVDYLMWLKDQIIRKGIVSFDYETDGDPDSKDNKAFEQQVVGVSFAYEIGSAFYLPIAHDSYTGNWDMEWLVKHFMKPVLEHPDVLVIAQYAVAEYTWSILNSVNLMPKAIEGKVLDTYYMIKLIAPSPLVVQWGEKEKLGVNVSRKKPGEVLKGLKQAAKALLADENGIVHGLLHVDEIKSFEETVGTYEVDVVEQDKKGNWKTVKKQKHRTFNMLPVDKHTIDYACSDSDWTLGLFYKLMPHIDRLGLRDLLSLYTAFGMLLGDIEMTGWCVDTPLMDEYGKQAEKMLKGYTDEQGVYHPGLEEQLHDAFLELVDKLNLDVEYNDDGLPCIPRGTIMDFGEAWIRGKGTERITEEIKQRKAFSWTDQQLRWLFFHVLKFPLYLTKRTDTGLPKVNSDFIDLIAEKYGEEYPFIPLLKKMKSYKKLLSTYIDGYKKHLREGRLHTTFMDVATSRLSSSAPNLQNIPKAYKDDLGIRKLFKAPTYDLTKDYSDWNPFKRPPEIMFKRNLSGETLYISADYSQIELRVLAFYANEQAMINAFWNKLDIHSQTAKDVFNLPCPVEEVKDKYEEMRKSAKAVNFGIVYGISGDGLARNPDLRGKITPEQGDKIIQDYLNRYPGVKRFMEQQKRFARKNHYVCNAFGFRRMIPHINDPRRWVRSKAERLAMNTPIQSTAADIFKLAQVRLEIEAEKRFPEGVYKQVMPIHDDLVAEVPLEYAVECLRFQKEVMEMPVPGISPDVVPIVADPAVGKVWGRSADVEFTDDGRALAKVKEKMAKEMGYELELLDKAGFEIVIKKEDKK